jgi:hypothetical protein
MGKKKNVVKPAAQEWEFEDTEPSDQEYTDRVLVLRKEPIPRKVRLMDAGAKEIRCVCCVRIRPIAGAEEFGDGWICEDCLPDVQARRNTDGSAEHSPHSVQRHGKGLTSTFGA